MYICCMKIPASRVLKDCNFLQEIDVLNLEKLMIIFDLILGLLNMDKLYLYLK